MAARAIWKGHLEVGELSCAIALYAAASTSERISFHIVNRKTGNRVHREYVDEETGRPVERDDRVRGYETAKGEYVMLEPEEIAAAVPEADKRLSIESFIPCGEVDTVYFDKPYFVAPADEAADGAFADIPDLKIKGEMLDLAKHIIGTKAGSFDPAGFDDRYDAALAELVQARIEGREIAKPKPKSETRTIDLMEALRESAAAARKRAPAKTAPKRKAG